MIAGMKSGGNHPPQLGKLVNCNTRINSAATVAEETRVEMIGTGFPSQK
jgi:hypothetical protein